MLVVMEMVRQNAVYKNSNMGSLCVRDWKPYKEVLTVIIFFFLCRLKDGIMNYTGRDLENLIPIQLTLALVTTHKPQC